MFVGPARAGMIRGRACQTCRVSRWPRTSGDDPTVLGGGDESNELAPHERG